MAKRKQLPHHVHFGQGAGGLRVYALSRRNGKEALVDICREVSTHFQSNKLFFFSVLSDIRANHDKPGTKSTRKARRHWSGLFGDDRMSRIVVRFPSVELEAGRDLRSKSTEQQRSPKTNGIRPNAARLFVKGPSDGVLGIDYLLIYVGLIYSLVIFLRWINVLPKRE
jgi:hypothetical protein